ncbi:zinc metalloprotease [Nonomuraea indica]|uniref:Zinc metalloprotease n=1 Tax=Nonomuraea indica TaxID=1581193 RepID=A0ABW8AGG5_9ACTN|nr:zinc metalloprotease [Nonomuraea indica]
MARRVTAVSLACLLAAGLTPPLQLHAVATASAGCAAPPGTPPPSPHAGGRPARHDAHAEAHDPAHPHVLRLGPEPRTPYPHDVGRVLAELDKRLQGREPPARVTVPVWVHILTDGAVGASTASVTAQLGTLRAAYGGSLGGAATGVGFRLAGAQVVRHAGWFTDPMGHEEEMKAALRKGGPETLNLYLAQLDGQVLGFSTYPYWYRDSPRLDGVVIDWRTLPGGALANYNRGYTGVHEIGHWLGLFHTFENGCQSPGDGVADTAPAARPAQGCPGGGKDTCPQAGRDPVHNFMDYAHDRCMSEFTRGQGERMREMWVVYRDRDAAASASR